MSIKFEGINYTYMVGGPFEKAALKDINLTIPNGEFVGVIGHTGSGKSTLMQLLNGLLQPTSGRILIDGVDVFAKGTNKREIREKVGLCFQYPEYQLFEETVYRDIAFGPKNMGYDDARVKQTVFEAMDMVGVAPELLEKSPFELSGGQKRRVAIAGVLAMEPSVLILDEPTAGLDPRGRDEILGRIQALHQKKKITVLLVSHSMEDVAKTVSKILVMNQGQVDLYGTVSEVFAHGPHLEEIGLSVPQVTKVMAKLKEMGYPVNPATYTLDSAKKQIIQLLGGAGNA